MQDEEKDAGLELELRLGAARLTLSGLSGSPFFKLDLQRALRSKDLPMDEQATWIARELLKLETVLASVRTHLVDALADYESLGLQKPGTKT